MIRIINLRKFKPTEPYDVCVDRATPLGNRFRMKIGGGNRNKVCDAYNNEFQKKVLYEHKQFMAELNRLIKLYNKYNKLRLFCWCVPKRCHAETIRAYILEHKDKINDVQKKKIT